VGELADSSATVDGDLAAAAGILARGEGVSWAYELLAELAARHRLTDAWVVVDPVSWPGAPGRQIFALGGTAVPLGTARELLGRPPGFYGEPRGLDPVTSAALGAMCATAFRGSVASMRAAVDPVSGLASRAAIGAAIARAAACAARYGWSSTLVRLTTGGGASAEDRWLALAEALPRALRTGDEAGVTSSGVALALLGNAGPDAVRPFVARIRAALSAAGRDDIDLHAATARTPEETVDPAELERLAQERLADAGIVTTTVPDTSSALELELRHLPGVVCVEMATPVVVLSSSASESLHEQVLRLARSRLPNASVRVLVVSDAPPDARGAAGGADLHVGAVHHVNGNGVTAPQEAAPLAISAMAPGEDAVATAGGARVSLLGATFDAARGTSEVSLALGSTRGTGRATAGPLAGGAQATLNALRALSVDVPFYLVSAERAHAVPGEPVVVVLSPRRTGAEATDGEGGGWPVERLGVANGTEDVEAASRATLGALNRHLTRSPATR
jgi:hypothetical protein